MGKKQLSRNNELIQKRIRELEISRSFDIDAEDDPKTAAILPHEVDYLHKKLMTRIKAKWGFLLAHLYLYRLERKHEFKIECINGIENLSTCENGGVITCNHFHPLDSFAMEKVFEASKFKKTKRMFRIIREGNYKAFKGFLGLIMRYCHTLPLASSLEVFKEFMRATNTILSRGDFVLVYAEESMWWNYRKPKPLKNGAFRFAITNNVPIIPIFMTMKDGDKLDKEGNPYQIYVVNIGKPIYKDKEKSLKENINMMKAQNYMFNKKTYENFYQKKLQYN